MIIFTNLESYDTEIECLPSMQQAQTSSFQTESQEITSQITNQVPSPRIPDSIDEVSDNTHQLSLETFSQEVLFDRNSHISLPDIDMIIPSEQRRYLTLRHLANNDAILNDAMESDNFPAWLLHLLNISDTTSIDDTVENEPHFYSQGDGLGIHPSISNLSAATTTSTASLGNSVIIPLGPTLVTTTEPSENDGSDEYYSLDESNLPFVGESPTTGTFDFTESELNFIVDNLPESKPPDQSTSREQ